MAPLAAAVRYAGRRRPHDAQRVRRSRASRMDLELRLDGARPLSGRTAAPDRRRDRASAGAVYDRTVTEPVKGKKKKLSPDAWLEARALVWTYRKRLALGLALMLISRAAGLVAPFSTKWFMDDVITKQHWELLPRIGLFVGIAAIVDAIASFANSQVLGVAGQRAITVMRKSVEKHVMHL